MKNPVLLSEKRGGVRWVHGNPLNGLRILISKIYHGRFARVKFFSSACGCNSTLILKGKAALAIQLNTNSGFGLIPAAISAVKTISAIEVAAALFARPSFQYPFKSHADSGLA